MEEPTTARCCYEVHTGLGPCHRSQAENCFLCTRTDCDHLKANRNAPKETEKGGVQSVTLWGDDFTGIDGKVFKYENGEWHLLSAPKELPVPESLKPEKTDRDALVAQASKINEIIEFLRQRDS